MSDHSTTVIVDPRSVGVHYNDRIRLASRNAIADEIRWRLDEIKHNIKIPLHLSVCSISKAAE